MLNAKKVIPPLAAVSFALTGCGDSAGDGGAGGHGGDGGEGGVGGGSEPTAEAIEQFCLKVVECYPDQTQGQCEFREQYIVDEYISDRCLAPWLSYLNCMAGLSCDEFESEEGFEACVEEVANEFGQALVDECRA